MILFPCLSISAKSAVRYLFLVFLVPRFSSPAIGLGLEQRLTGVEPQRVVREVLA
jgi:hypothetical protein